MKPLYKLKVPISWLGILHIYNIWNPVIRIAIYRILSFENFIFVDFLAVKVNGSDVKPGICVTVNTRSYRHTEIFKFMARLYIKTSWS